MELANDYDTKIRGDFLFSRSARTSFYGPRGDIFPSCCCLCTEIEVRYQKNMQRVTEDEEKKRRTELIEIEDRMKSRIVSLVEDHDRALRGAEEYYCASQKKLLVDQKMLKVRRQNLEMIIK